jgi:NAD(P)-dependent dehydrogenase (short-subunit alcohol dehydrogenase family)
MTEERHIIVAGGTRGIGKAFVKVCLERGWSVSVLSRSGNAPEGCFGISADLTDALQVDSALKHITDKNGPLTSAAFFQRYRGEEDGWMNHWNTSVVAISQAIMAMVPYFSNLSDKGVVIVSSNASLYVANEQDASYHASRSAQLGLMRYLAVKLGSSGIRVNCVSLGTVLKEENLSFFKQDSPKRLRCEAVSPLKRMGHASEVASVVEFLCSDRASWITGQNILCDGGASLLSSESTI